MKRLVLFAATLLLCSLAYAQPSTAPISGRAFDQYGQPIAFPQIRVCAASSTGVPCTPTIPIYQDYLQTIPVANPYYGDAFGNFTIYAGTLPFPNLYTIQVSANQGLTWSYVENGPGGSGGSVSLLWGSITGTLSNQTDLEAALDSKAASDASTTVNDQSCALGSSCTVPSASIPGPHGGIVFTDASGYPVVDSNGYLWWDDINLNLLVTDSSGQTTYIYPGWMELSGSMQAQSIVDTGITPSTSPICPNGTSGAFTTVGCVAGSTISGLTTNKIPKATSSTTISAP